MTSTTTTTILWPFSRTIRVSQCQKRTSGLYGLYIFKRVMKKLKNKNPEAQKKRSSHKVHGVSPEVIAQKGVYGGKDL